LDIFRKLLLIRSWCPDRTLPQAKKYIADSIGERYIEGVVLDLEKMLDESEPRTPLICFLYMGSDPTTIIEQLGKRKNIDVKVKCPSNNDSVEPCPCLALLYPSFSPSHSHAP